MDNNVKKINDSLGIVTDSESEPVGYNTRIIKSLTITDEINVINNKINSIKEDTNKLSKDIEGLNSTINEIKKLHNDYVVG